jgi:SAM-dependent methyltransferase
MAFSCRICENTENNRIHEAREMMFGLRDRFDYVECGECGTIQIKEIPELAPYYPKNYFSLESGAQIEFAKKLKRRLAARFAGDYFVNKRNFIGKYIAEKKSWIKGQFPAALRDFPLGINFQSKILDFGCGTGKPLQVLYQFGFRNLTGADAFIDADIFYPNGVKIYKKRLDELEPFYDLITLNHSFEHLPNPLESLREIGRLLAKDKFALIRIPVAGFAWEKYGTNWVQLDAPRHLYLYTEKSFRFLAGKAGFTVEKVIYDSTAFQFWGSEQYQRDIPLSDERTFKDDISKSIFTQEEMDAWESEAEKLNAQNKGDQACFYLRMNDEL